jgi:hypothetical protein
MTHEELTGRKRERKFINHLKKEIGEQKGLVEYLNNIRKRYGSLQSGKEQIIQDYKNGTSPIPFVGKVFEKKAIFESAQKAGGLDAVFKDHTEEKLFVDYSTAIPDELEIGDDVIDIKISLGWLGFFKWNIADLTKNRYWIQTEC